MVRAGPRGGAAAGAIRRAATWSDEAEAIFLDALAASCGRLPGRGRGRILDTERSTPPPPRQPPSRAAGRALRQGFARLEMELSRRGHRTVAPDLEPGFDHGLRPMPPMTVAEAIERPQAAPPAVTGEGQAPAGRGQFRRGCRWTRSRRVDPRQARGDRATPAAEKKRPGPADARRAFASASPRCRPAVRKNARPTVTPAGRTPSMTDWPSWAHDGQRRPACANGLADLGDHGRPRLRQDPSPARARPYRPDVASHSAKPCRRGIALVGATLDEARRVMVEGRAACSRSPRLDRRLAARASAACASAPGPRTLFSGATPEPCAAPSITSPGATSSPSGRRPRRAGTCSSSACASATPRALSPPPLTKARCWDESWPSRGTWLSGGRTAANSNTMNEARQLVLLPTTRYTDEESPANRPVHLRRLFTAALDRAGLEPPPKRSLVRVTMTSSWPTKSPDPMGLTYNPRAKRLLISDAEVDEMPALWKGKNLFVAKRGGGLITTGTFKKFTHEPEDLAWDNKHQVLFVTDDDLDRVFRVGRGKDKRLGTRDDVVATVLHTHRFGSFDPEGLAWLGVASPCCSVSDSDQPARVQDPPRQRPEVRHPRRRRAELRDPQVRVHDGRGRGRQGQAPLHRQQPAAVRPRDHDEGRLDPEDRPHRSGISRPRGSPSLRERTAEGVACT